jgi:hypothetical protein
MASYQETPTWVANRLKYCNQERINSKIISNLFLIMPDKEDCSLQLKNFRPSKFKDRGLRVREVEELQNKKDLPNRILGQQSLKSPISKTKEVVPKRTWSTWYQTSLMTLGPSIIFGSPSNQWKMIILPQVTSGRETSILYYLANIETLRRVRLESTQMEETKGNIGDLQSGATRSQAIVSH